MTDTDYEKLWYCAVRKATDDGHEWKDIKTIGPLLVTTNELINLINREAGPQWANANPVIKIVLVKIEEVKI